MDHNAWSPPGPGKHGYMQVGLGRDRNLFIEGEHRHVFVGTGKHFLYCGWYHVVRVEALSKEEWGTLPPKVKRTYSETTMNKEKSSAIRSADQALAMYDSGELRAPCVRLQCVQFDTAFYQELVRANEQFFSSRPRPGGAGVPGPSKRRRVTRAGASKDEDNEEVSLACAVTTTSGQASASVASAPALPGSSSAKGHQAESSGSASVIRVTHGVLSLSSSPVPGGSGHASAGAPSMRQTRTSTRSQAAQGSMTLRIPGGRSVERTSQSASEDVLELSSNDDDDLYADW
ncbi:hypothetical protein C8Q77DRAFT_84355 [Trametes polyzona]|nr:hypothetical protein C8Q77DRAFT_84355 [Trametes polyzona]